MKAVEFRPGMRVTYVPLHAHGDANHPDCEQGVVTSNNGINVFVRYYKRGILKETPEATSPEDLTKR